MESNPPSQTLETPLLESQGSEDLQQPLELTKTLPIASISLFISSLLSSTRKPSLSPFSRFKFHSHISSLVYLSLSTSSSRPPSKISTPSRIAKSPCQFPFPLLLCYLTDPSHFTFDHRCTIIWFCADLCIHDNEALMATINDSLSLLPIYIFDPRDPGKSSSTRLDPTAPPSSSSPLLISTAGFTNRAPTSLSRLAAGDRVGGACPCCQ